MEMSDKYIIWLDSAIPLSGEKTPNRVNTEMEGFFPLYNIFEKKTRISYAEYEVERMEIEKES